MIVIKLGTENAAFQDGNRHSEVAAALQRIIDKLAIGCMPSGVYDTNGNRVGTITLTGKDREL